MHGFYLFSILNYVGALFYSLARSELQSKRTSAEPAPTTPRVVGTNATLQKSEALVLWRGLTMEKIAAFKALKGE
jgi:hypothetical protein